MGDHAVRERLTLVVRRVRPGPLCGAVLDLLVELDQLRAGQLGERSVQPVRQVLVRLVRERRDRALGALPLAHLREVGLDPLADGRPGWRLLAVRRGGRVHPHRELAEHPPRLDARQLDSPAMSLIAGLTEDAELGLDPLALRSCHTAVHHERLDPGPAHDHAEPGQLLVPVVRLRRIRRARERGHGPLRELDRRHRAPLASLLPRNPPRNQGSDREGRRQTDKSRFLVGDRQDRMAR